MTPLDSYDAVARLRDVLDQTRAELAEAKAPSNSSRHLLRLRQADIPDRSTAVLGLLDAELPRQVLTPSHRGEKAETEPVSPETKLLLLGVVIGALLAITVGAVVVTVWLEVLERKSARNANQESRPVGFRVSR